MKGKSIYQECDTEINRQWLFKIIDKHALIYDKVSPQLAVDYSIKYIALLLTNLIATFVEPHEQQKVFKFHIKEIKKRILVDLAKLKENT